MPKAERKLPVVLTLAQLEELLALPLTLPKDQQAPAWGPARDAAILETFYSSGLRRQELVDLNAEDIDPVSGVIRVRGKGRKERLCLLGSHAMTALQRYRHEAGVHSGPLFLSTVRRRISPQAVAAWDRLAPALIRVIACSDDPQRALTRWERILESVPSAITTFRLLVARPHLIDRLVAALTLAPVLADEDATDGLPSIDPNAPPAAAAPVPAKLATSAAVIGAAAAAPAEAIIDA
jgi:hypothetical protein